MDTKSRNVILVYYVFKFLTGLHFISAVLVPFFTDWGHVSLFAAQSLQAWFTFWVFALEVPTGVVADTMGRKYSLALGTFTAAIAAVVYSSYPSVYVFAFGEFLFALGLALISGADNALLFDYLKEVGKEEEATKIFGRSRAIHLTAIALAAFLGGPIATKFGYQYPMAFTAIPMAITSVVVLFFPEKVHAVEDTESGFWNRNLEGLRKIRRSPVLRRWVINSALVDAAAYFVIWLYQPYMKSLGIPIQYFGFAHIGLVVAEVLVSSCFGIIRSKFGSRKFMYLSLFFTILGTFLPVVIPGIPTLVALIIFAGGFGLVRGEFMSFEMNKYLESKDRATVLSGVSMYRRVIQALLNPLIGFSADRSLVIAFLSVSLIPLLALFAPIKKEDFKE